MPHELDNPIWNALSTCHAHLSEGDRHAKRYNPGILPFFALRQCSPSTMDNLLALFQPKEPLISLARDFCTFSSGFSVVQHAAGVQMLSETGLPRVIDERVERLAERDAPDMLQLALLTRPGPFSLRSQALGAFWGIRIEGRLAAMAGQRFMLPGYRELSGICVHPDFQGRGLGRLMSRFVAGEITHMGDKPFLHSYADNEKAIRLYESIGFRHRADMHVAVLVKD